MRKFLAFFLIGTVSVVLLSQMALALDATQIGDIAKNITVLIDGGNPGTGVIVARKDSIYYVLTAQHVIETEDEYELITHDGEAYRITQEEYQQKVKKFPNLDLALLAFNSDRKYKTAILGNSVEMKPGADVFIYGFPNPGREIKNRIPQIQDGSLTANSSSAPAENGYALIYNVTTYKGMSGSPVFDNLGRVIGIHGRAEGEAENVSDETIQRIGTNLGIPIQTFINALPENNISLPLEIAEQAPKQQAAPPKSPGTRPTYIRPPKVSPSNFAPSDPVCSGNKC